MEIQIFSTSGNKPLGTLDTLRNSSTVRDVKRGVQRLSGLAPDRQSVRLEPRGKTLKDDDTVQGLGLKSGSRLYVKDLGPQIGWVTVFLAEYAGPLLIYLWFYQRPWLFYGTPDTPSPEPHYVVHFAAACWSVHYAKRILETLFVHRFSHATMPIMNLFKNCSYYWLFTAYVAYHVNHPLFTPPCDLQVYAGLAAFTLSELGNLSVHLALRDLRPPGTTVRKIPLPNWNPFTRLFHWVSCPNYTYEFFSWAAFTAMTQCLPAGIFALAGMYQMTVWALGKHRNYKKEFSSYPKQRKAILPFII